MENLPLSPSPLVRMGGGGGVGGGRLCIGKAKYPRTILYNDVRSIAFPGMEER